MDTILRRKTARELLELLEYHGAPGTELDHKIRVELSTRELRDLKEARDLMREKT